MDGFFLFYAKNRLALAKKMWYNKQKRGGVFVKRGGRILCALLVCCLVFSLVSCRGAVAVSELTISDAGGKGERVCHIYSPAVNDEYLLEGENLVSFLNEKLRASLGASAADYTLAYEGLLPASQVGEVDTLYEMPDEEREKGYHVFSMRYDFSDIKDYNRKTRRLYNLSKSLVLSNTDDTYRVGVLDDYVDTLLRVNERVNESGKPTGQYDVTLTETGSVSYGLVAWAMILLYQNRADETMWQSGTVYYAPFSPDETHTMFSALKTQVTVTVGETVRTVTPVTGPIIEGQGEVEGIIFNVSGILGAAVPEKMPTTWIVLLCVGCVLLGGLVVFLLILWQGRRAARRAVQKVHG